MTSKLLAAAAAISFALGTAAIAQTDTGTQVPPAAAPGGESSLPMGWDGAVGDAFFSDAELGTLRSQDEVQANWDTLSDEQQAQVRAHCDTMDTAALGTEDPLTDDTAAADIDDDADVMTGSIDTNPVHTASIQQVCDWIDTM